MSGTLKVGSKTLATHDTDTITLTADEANVGSNALVVDSNGNVGIGAITIDSLLHLEKNDLTAYDATATDGQVGVGPTIYLENPANNNATVGGQIVFGMRSTEAQTRIGATGGSAPALTFGTLDAERMRIDSSGNLLVNTTGEIRNANDLGISIEPEGRIYLGRGASSGGFAHLVFVNSNGVVGSVVTSGASTSYVTSSDYRLKENITEITDGITRVKQLNPSRFNFIADPDKTVDGFIAHEVQDIVPEAVSGEKNAVDSDGKPEYQGVDYGRITPLLTAALKEAIAKIEMLEARIAVLEAK